MKIDESNVAQFVGKTVDAKRRLFHYYPLTILYSDNIGYCYRDRNGVVCSNDFKREPIQYDWVVED